MATRTENQCKVVKIRTCDFCQKDEGWRVKPCNICGKDICGKCAIWTENECLEAGSYFSDYPDYYCQSCWDTGQELRERIHAIRKDAEDEEEVLWQAWKTCCGQRSVVVDKT